VVAAGYFFYGEDSALEADVGCSSVGLTSFDFEGEALLGASTLLTGYAGRVFIGCILDRIDEPVILAAVGLPSGLTSFVGLSSSLLRSSISGNSRIERRAFLPSCPQPMLSCDVQFIGLIGLFGSTGYSLILMGLLLA
jgi:hypothetical protein